MYLQLPMAEEEAKKNKKRMAGCHGLNRMKLQKKEGIR